MMRALILALALLHMPFREVPVPACVMEKEIEPLCAIEAENERAAGFFQCHAMFAHISLINLF